MQKLTIVKLGGSVITDKSKSLTAKPAVIKRLGKEILQSKYKGKLIITHGSGSFGHSVATKHETAEGYKGKKSIKGMVLTSDVAIQINRIVMGEFIKLGMVVKSFTPSSFLVAKEKKLYKGFAEPIKLSLERDITPVIFGDVVMDADRGFCIFSAEKVIESLVRVLYRQYEIDSIIYCTDTNGVYDGRGMTIPKIISKNFNNVKAQIGRSSSEDVTGGMVHKVKESLKLTKKYKFRVKIINGNRTGNLREALGGGKTKGTVLSD